VKQGHTNSLGEVEQFQAAEFQRDALLAVYIRADQRQEFGNVAELLDVLRRLGIKRMDIGMTPPKR
jgi:biopolymer transport protein ExbD